MGDLITKHTSMETLVQTLFKNRGLTLKILIHEYESFLTEKQYNKGYQVSIKDLTMIDLFFHENDLVFRYDQTFKMFLLEVVNEFNKEIDLEYNSTNQEFHIGLWIDDTNQLYIDLSIWVETFQQAKELGSQYNQKAIWDWGRSESVYLKKEEEK